MARCGAALGLCKTGRRVSRGLILIGKNLLFAPFPQPARAVSSRGALKTHGEQQALALLEEGLRVSKLAKEDLIGRVTPSSPAKEPKQGPH